MAVLSALKKTATVAAGVTCFAAGMATSSYAASITTTFAGGNSAAGNMFDVTTFGNALRITSLEINVESLATGGSVLDVYTKPGTYVGSETDSSVWTRVSSTALATASPVGTPTFVGITDFILGANSLTGFYITFESGSFLEYTDGSNTYSNADLRLDLGVGKAGLFGSTFSPRTWNGTINYEVIGDSTPIPTPAMLPGLIGMGLGFMRKRKAEATEQADDA